MLDLFHLQGTDYNINFFTAQGISTNFVWQTWTKPKNAKMIYMICVGAGGGGGGGIGDVIGSSSVGGGGGGSGAITVGLFHACTIPDLLYVYVGRKGSGGASSNNGNDGDDSFVNILPDRVLTGNRILFATNGVGGSSNNATPTGGAGGAVFTSNSAMVGALGILHLNAGQTGGASSTDNGSGLTATLSITGGAGGGGRTANFATYGSGGTVTTTGLIPSSTGGVSGSTVNGVDGYNGMRPSSNTSVSYPILFMGGSGGAPINGTGGRGGRGGIACGGGGGGSGITGGRGGDGGDGMVIIISI